MEEEFELPKNAKKTIKRLWQSVNDQYLTIVSKVKKKMKKKKANK